MLSFWASARLRRADATIPSNSLREARSTLRFPIFTRLSSSALPISKVLLGTTNKNLRRFADLVDDRPPVRRFAPPTLWQKEQSAHLPPQPALGSLCRRVQIRVVQVVSNHHEVDVAVGCVSFLCNRAVDKRSLDRVGVWFE